MYNFVFFLSINIPSNITRSTSTTTQTEAAQVYENLGIRIRLSAALMAAAMY